MINPPLRSKRGTAVAIFLDDVQMMDKIIHNTRFNLTGKSEREFELAFMSSARSTGQI